MHLIMNNKIKLLSDDTYLAIIKNSVGAKTWQNSWARQGEKRIDLVKGGDLSCAFFVSSILKLFNLITNIHVTVGGAIVDLEKSGWRKTKSFKPGDIIVWGPKLGRDGQEHRHLGFCLGGDRAVSNSSKAKKIALHHVTYGKKKGRPVRAIEAIYTHKKLN